NSGTSDGVYSVVVTRLEGQPEFLPDPKWFSFRPERFSLKPGERQDVAVTLTLPWLLQPGDYFCLLQVGPSVEAQGTGLAVAAAAKLTFRVEHGNILTATVFTVIDEVQKRAPWSYLILAALVLVAGYPLLARVTGIRISVQRR